MAKLFEIYKETMLSPKVVLEVAVKKAILSAHTKESIKANFSSIVNQIAKGAYTVFLAEQEAAGKNAIRKYFEELVPAKASRDEAIRHMANSFEEFDRFFLSLTQSRKPRAGGTFEWIIKDLFKRLDYPFAEQQVINGKPDFLMPSRKHYDVNPMDCIIFTVKTTLRERWRQIVTEGTRGLGFFLATVDENVSEPQLAEMLRNRIYLVVCEDLKQSIPHYNAAPNVISFERFFADFLDPAVQRWKRMGSSA